MRPPILRWKVVLGLLVIVIAAVSVGSALRPDAQHPGSAPVRIFYGHGMNSVPGGPTNGDFPPAITAHLWQNWCLMSKRMLRAHPNGPDAREWRQFVRACHRR